MKFFTFYHFDPDPRFPPFLLYVRWKSGVTFVRRCFRDANLHTLQKNSSSLIDLFLCRNPANVLYSGAIDPFISDQVRYHCPILVLLKFVCPKPKLTKRKIWYYQRADFNRYRELLSEYDFHNNVELEPNIDNIVNVINKTILEAAEKSVPNKVVTI